MSEEIEIDKLENGVTITKGGDGGWSISVTSNVCSMNNLKEFIAELKETFIDEPQTKKDNVLNGAG